YVAVLDPTPDCPAAQAADKQILGDFYDEDKLRELVEDCDVTTFDIEHINTEVLKKLVNEGNRIYPSPYLLEIVQDKLKQKEVLNKGGIPVPKYEKVEKFDPLYFEKFGFPCVQKARKGGYDGRGVIVLKDKSDLENAIKAESLLEELVDFEKELAVMVARNTEGEAICYPVVEMVFDERANICDMVIAPAKIEKEIEEEAKKIAIKSIGILDGTGIFGVEMFLTRDGKILVNEIAPRPHNSGHYTIEACVTCQFEQHIRAICGLPLGSTELLSPAVMINLLGEEGYKGKTVVEGLKRALSIPGASFHLYGKATTQPFRKMGHITILDKNLEKAIEKAKEVKSFIKITGE
ncbi:MAG: 5-(carboxyamino)imidazole ribonucleotide synthase, partial [Candidatus Methanoperedens sp.]|nr:5-(carboxyamino)imidazole ribonucleotide synthase [Candidatus Methanoperedens sp.]